MAYAFYHPTGDPSNELQLYIFEMADPLKALGKYGSEKPEEFQPVPIGDQGYTTAGSTLFYAGKYYTQIVSTAGRPQVRRLRAGPGQAGRRPQKPGAAAAAERGPEPDGRRGHARPEPRPTAGTGRRDQAGRRRPSRPPPRSPRRRSSACLPAQGREGEPKYVAQDVFGYSFLSDVFMADYKEGDVTWQGFLRPYRDAQEAKAVFQKYIDGVKKDGAEVKTIAAEGADEIVVSTNIGLVDVVFRKGNTVAGANGATAAPQAEAFARALAKSLPASVPDTRDRQVTPRHATHAEADRSGDNAISAATDDGFRGETLIPTEADDGRETDPDAAEEPGEVRRGEPGRPAVFPAAVRHAGRRLRPGGRRCGGRRPAAPRPLGHGRGQAAAAGPAEGLRRRAAGRPAQPGRRPLPPRPRRGPSPPRTRS